MTNCIHCDIAERYSNSDTKISNTYDILWVGISAKIGEEPLSETTNTGKLVKQIEAACGKPGYKTNLVKCPPVDKNGKLRYPNQAEIDCCYDGFYGPGTGTFLLILYTGVAKLPVAKASGTMKLANLSSNIMALVVFLFSGKIVIYLGLAASVFSIAGHYVGSGMVMKNGNKIVRPIILIVLVLLFIKIITGM